MELVYGTKNAAKLASMRKTVQKLSPEFDVKVIGLDDLDISLPDVEENGGDPLENARIKALAYYGILKRPVFSADSGLYFDGLPESLQPGLDVRRVNGKRLTDEEMIEHYSRLARDNGGRLTGRYINGVCLVMGDGLFFEHMGDDISTEGFYIIEKPHIKRVEGFPLDSLSVHIKSGKYYYDMTDADRDKEKVWGIENGFLAFYRSAFRVYANRG